MDQNLAAPLLSEDEGLFRLVREEADYYVVRVKTPSNPKESVTFNFRGSSTSAVAPPSRWDKPDFLARVPKSICTPKEDVAQVENCVVIPVVTALPAPTFPSTWVCVCPNGVQADVSNCPAFQQVGHRAKFKSQITAVAIHGSGACRWIVASNGVRYPMQSPVWTFDTFSRTEDVRADGIILSSLDGSRLYVPNADLDAGCATCGAVVGFCIPIVGCVTWCVNKDAVKGTPRAKMALIALRIACVMAGLYAILNISVASSN